MYLVIVTAALFMAILFYDLLKENPNNTTTRNHVFFGLAAIGAMSTLVYLEMEYVGWGLLIIPIAAIFITFLLTDSNTYTISPSAYTPPVSTGTGTGTGTGTAKGTARVT